MLLFTPAEKAGWIVKTMTLKPVSYFMAATDLVESPPTSTYPPFARSRIYIDESVR